MCLFVIGKVGQRKTLSGQRKILSSQRKTLFDQRKTLSDQFQSRKIWLVFQESVFPLAAFVFRKVVSRKSLSKLSCVCLSLWKFVNGKHFPVKGKFGLNFRKVFSWKIWGENTFRKLWKNLEMSLFADYIKFDPQTFDCYIYFVLNIYFLISSLKILFLY